MKIRLVFISCLLAACTSQPAKTIGVWSERPIRSNQVFDIAWFDGEWRLCEMGKDCPKITPKLAIRSVVSSNTTLSASTHTSKNKKVSVHFSFDSTTPINLIELEEFIHTIGAHDRLVITGYTDSLGEENYNELLARKRANKVSAWLKQRGIKNLMTVAVGGACCYLSANDTDRGRALNRRVIVEIFHKENKHE